MITTVGSACGPGSSAIGLAILGGGPSACGVLQPVRWVFSCFFVFILLCCVLSFFLSLWLFLPPPPPPPFFWVGPSSVPAFCDSSVPAGIHSFLPTWWAQMSQIGSPLCSKLHKCSTHKYCVGADDLRAFQPLQLLENILRNCQGVYYGSRAVRCGICVFCILFAFSAMLKPCVVKECRV